MYLMYVDESGDAGVFTGGNSQHYILSGIIIHVNDWKDCLERLVKYRKSLRDSIGLQPRVELHCSELIRIQKIEEYKAIPKYLRMALINSFVSEMPIIFSKGKIINICLKKLELPQCKDFQVLAWSRLIQRYDTFLKKTDNSKGIIISDDSGEAILRALLRKMRVYNPVTSHFQRYHNPVIDNIIEDIFYRDSSHSHIIQAADFIAHCLYRKEFPKGSLKKYGLDRVFNTLEPILLKQASNIDQLGIVRK
ncbi:DUF3800 domain-containing protein [Adhaeribacter radiodurans]|uniref:DUF3800 domain-containing protein n=1 Tax=Adhaeribacter radiodurans TaxID=2745197 RepID=A0A7L7LC83_9BACT|nr:DUF3800 domain-containing protein [Adhaeribacter radiodurans]QMU30145.1 DUF3800 domain-containing protein [Adhaeribacter radiodurans]